MSRRVYPSDVSREQFEKIRGMLEGARKKTRPRSVDLYDVFCAVLYLIKSGCQWRMLPSDFPKWENVYAYFSIWNTKLDGKEVTLLEEILKKIDWRGETKQWSQREDNLSHYRRTEC